MVSKGTHFRYIMISHKMGRRSSRANGKILPHLFCRQPLGRVQNKQFVDKVFGNVTHFVPVGRGVFVLAASYCFKKCLVIVIVKRRKAAEENIGNNCEAE